MSGEEFRVIIDGMIHRRAHAPRSSPRLGEVARWSTVVSPNEPLTDRSQPGDKTALARFETRHGESFKRCSNVTALERVTR